MLNFQRYDVMPDDLAALEAETGVALTEADALGLTDIMNPAVMGDA